MALSKFNEWVYKEMGEPLSGDHDVTHDEAQLLDDKEIAPEVDKLKGTLGNLVNKLLQKIDTMGGKIQKNRALPIIMAIINKIMERSNISGQVGAKLQQATNLAAKAIR